MEFSVDPELPSSDPALFATAKTVVNHIRNAPKNHHDKLNELSLTNVG